jgi:predicted nucleotidyltransferase
METKNNSTEGVLAVLLKEPFLIHTATSVARALSITRQGIWKTLNKLEKNKLINLEPIGSAKTSTAIIHLKWENPVVEKTLSLLLTKEASKQQRWEVNFAELKTNVKFLILFGSILINPKEANDIDILAVVDRKNFKAVEETTAKIQQTQLKKIHLIDLTEAEFNQEFFNS